MIKRPHFFLLAFGLILAGCGASPTQDASMTPATPSPAGEVLLFDDFSDGQLDRSVWNVEGPDFWVNFEQQIYVDSSATIQFLDGVEGAENGVLALKGVYSPGYEAPGGRIADFISGRIDSQNKFDFTYGRAEARIKLPDAEGMWPAFWLLGNGRWPDTGEIDIMEYVGETDWTGVALHGPGYSGETPLVDKFFFPEGEDVSDWHTYAVEWTDQAILFFVDDRLTYRATRPMVEHYGEWRFDNPKYLILNTALGGAYPFKTSRIESPYAGLPGSTVDMIRNGDVAMLVDWVRVTAP